MEDRFKRTKQKKGLGPPIYGSSYPSISIQHDTDLMTMNLLVARRTGNFYSTPYNKKREYIILY